jgi:hypothetical protein
MIAPGRATPAAAQRLVLAAAGESAGERAVPALARELAARLSALFEADSRIAQRLNDAQRRLRYANDRLWSGLHPDALGLIYDAHAAAAAGGSEIAGLVGAALGAGGRGSRAAVLEALQQIHWAIHRAFCEYQRACEERRQLAVDVGELSRQLIEVLCAAGFSERDARSVDVHELAGAGGL